MNKMDEIEKQLNRMFQFMFKENKRYIFIEDDVKGFIDINVADEKAFTFIIQDKQRFYLLVDNYLDIHDIRIRKYKGTLPDLTEKPQLLNQEVVVTKYIKQYIKQRVFVAKRVKVYVEKPVVKNIINTFEGIQEVEKLINELKGKLFELRDAAWNRNEENPSKNEDYFLYGTYLTVSESYTYIKEIEKVLCEAKENEKKDISKQIKQFMYEEYDKIKEDNLRIMDKYKEENQNLYKSVQWADNWGQINFMGKLNEFLNKIKDYEEE